METIDLLKKSLLFKGCTHQDFELLSSLFVERKVSANTTIFSEKMPGEALYIIKGPKGWKYSRKIQDKNVLKQVKVGDQVDFTWTEAVMIEVTAPKK